MNDSKTASVLPSVLTVVAVAGLTAGGLMMAQRHLGSAKPNPARLPREGEVLFKGRKPKTMKEAFKALRAAGYEVAEENHKVSGCYAMVYTPKGKSFAHTHESHVASVQEEEDALLICEDRLVDCDPDCTCGWDE